MFKLLQSLFLTIWFFLFLGACGYHLEGQQESVSGKPLRLYIELFENRSGRAFVNAELTSRIVERFSRSPRYQLVETPQTAELILSGVILDYDATPLAYDRNDAIAAHRVALKIQVALRRTDTGGGLIWKGGLSEEKDYSVNRDRAMQQAAEQEATSTVCERLAIDLYSRLADEVAWPVKISL